jgi:hypothetical protein
MKSNCHPEQGALWASSDPRGRTESKDLRGIPTEMSFDLPPKILRLCKSSGSPLNGAGLRIDLLRFE